MKKALFITNSMLFGGAEKVIATLCNDFCDRGIECIIATLHNRECVYSLRSGVRIYPLYQKEGIPKRSEFFKCFINLRRFVKKEKPDTIIAMPEQVSAKAIPFLLGLDVSIIVSERNNPKIMPKSKITRLFRKLFYPLVDGYVFQTKEQSMFFSKRIRDKGIIILNPLDIERLPNDVLETKRKEIVTVGRLDKQKNQRLLIEAFAKFQTKHNDYKLCIYGDGEMKDSLQRYAKRLLYENSYEFLGATNDVLSKINGASMFVLSSDYEGLPNALIEAMAVGLCCIATDCPCGGPRELITDREDGLLVPVGDVVALEEAMIYVVDNEKKANDMKEKAKLTSSLLQPHLICKQWIDYIDTILTK